ncbi:hypothetical protein LTR81_026535 [Elasticomyces elasticus]
MSHPPFQDTQQHPAILLPRENARSGQDLPTTPEGGRNEWRDSQLSYWLLGLMLIVQLGLIGTLVVLVTLSRERKGFVAVGGDIALRLSIDSYEARTTLSETVFWTTIPTLFMTLFAMAWGNVVSAYADEMPFRALREGGTLGQTVCLDYRRSSSCYNYIIAWKNGHILLGFCMFSALTATVALVPLAAHLFQVSTPTFTNNAAFPQTTVYNESNLVPLIDYQPVIGMVSAVKVYGGNWPTWTDGTYAVPAFNSPANVSKTTNVNEFEINTTAHFAALDCQYLTEYNLTRDSANEDTTLISLEAIDRGCNVSLTAGVGPGNTNYLHLVSNDNCPEGTNYSRISYLAGAYSASATYLLDSISVISCIPSYAQANGTLTSPPSFLPLSFKPDSQTQSDARPSDWRLFEQQLIAVSNLGNSNSPDYTSQFGQLILDMIIAEDPSLILDPTTLISATSRAFASAFAVPAKIHLFPSSVQEPAATGSVISFQTRLVTVRWSVYTSIVILGVFAILNVLLMVILSQKRPILTEEPYGILGAAVLLRNSNLQELVNNEEWRRRHGGQFYEWLKEEYELGRERCTINADSVITVERLVRKSKEAL